MQAGASTRSNVTTVPLRPAWVEIDLAAIEQNARRLCEIVGPDVALMAMVKANAYGHGAVETARAALRGGAGWLGVYAAGEGLELREAGITAPILVVGPTPVEWAHAAFENDLTLTAGSAAACRDLAAAAANSQRPVRLHVKIDTGMTRLGVNVDEAPALIRELARARNVQVEGVYTHFAVADDPNARGIPGWGEQYTRRQFELLQQVIDQLRREGIEIPLCHAANSPALLNYGASRLNLVRSGILLYGLDPSPEVPRPPGLKPALAFKSRLALIRQVPRGTFVSYGATFETRRDSRLGVLMAGYADGFRRGPKNYGHVLVCGQPAPIAGRVCMDQTMIDLTDIPAAREGDEVVLIGRQGEAEISAEQVAERVGTNNYEVVTTISPRVPRIYRK